MRRLAACATAAALALAAPAAAKPQRIVSMNLCADQLVMLLADRSRIASVSYVAADGAVSAMAADAVGLRLNHGLVEEVLPLAPDLVLTGAFDARPTTGLLRRLGYPVLRLAMAESFAEIRDNIARVAAALGEDARGARLIAAFDRRLAAAARAHRRGRIAAIYRANGYTWGRDTLADAVLTAAGLGNWAATLGIAGTGRLPLETLLSAPLDVLIVARAPDPHPALATELFSHPALRAATARLQVVTLPGHLFVCGTPHVADAVARLAALAPPEASPRPAP